MKKITHRYGFLLLPVLLISLLFSIATYAQQAKKKVVKPPPPPENPFQLGEEAYYKKDYLKAIQYFNKIVAQNPDTAVVVYYIASSNLNLGDYKKGISFYRKAIELDSKFKDSLRMLVYSEIPIQLFRSNYDGDELITKVANGLRVSGFTFVEDASEKVLNEIAYPVWGEAAQVIGYGAEIGGFYNPVSVSLSYMDGEIDLKTVKQRFALPPLIPDPYSTGYDYKIKTKAINLSVLYTPAIFGYGFLYPSLGACVVISSYKHGSITKNYVSPGVSLELMLKYKNLFLKGVFKKGIDNKTFDNHMALHFGFKINMFN